MIMGPWKVFTTRHEELHSHSGQPSQAAATTLPLAQRRQQSPSTIPQTAKRRQFAPGLRIMRFQTRKKCSRCHEQQISRTMRRKHCSFAFATAPGRHCTSQRHHLHKPFLHSKGATFVSWMQTACQARLFSLVHCRFIPHGKIKWVPWQLRMSERQYKEIIEARAARTLRTEAQLISTALFDDARELSINHANLSPAWLARTQTIMRNAIALCKGAHLRVLKAFDKRMHELATQSLAADSGLRTVSTQELRQADCKTWYEIVSMHGEGWTRDQGLHEITKIRSDLPALLQPRAKAAGIAKGKPNKKSDGKGLAKGAKNQILKDAASPQLSAALQNLATKHGNKTLCLKYNRGACTNKQCKFTHLCTVKLPNGQSCGQRHPTHTHRFKRAEGKGSQIPPCTACLLRLAFSGLVGVIWSAPPCKEFSVLKWAQASTHAAAHGCFAIQQPRRASARQAPRYMRGHGNS